MINQDKWINSIAKTSYKNNEESNQIDHDRWVNTISKKKKFNSVKKYSLTGVLFICGLLIVSVVKNETRILQKEINNLKSSVNVIKFNLDQAKLDHEVITSPENIAKLATEYLNYDLASYNRSQIRHLNDKNKEFVEKTEAKKIDNEKLVSIKNQVAKKIEDKKLEIKKLQKLYSDPKLIPDQIKLSVAKQIKEKKQELKNIYDSPGGFITSAKVREWGVVQVVKAVLGIPIIPGR